MAAGDLGRKIRQSGIYKDVPIGSEKVLVRVRPMRASTALELRSMSSFGGKKDEAGAEDILNPRTAPIIFRALAESCSDPVTGEGVFEGADQVAEMDIELLNPLFTALGELGSKQGAEQAKS